MIAFIDSNLYTASGCAKMTAPITRLVFLTVICFSMISCQCCHQHGTSGCSGSSECTNAITPQESKALQEQFLYKGKPIHPFIIEKFLCWISDHESPVLVVNLASTERSNEFAAQVVGRDGQFSSERTVHSLNGDEVLVFSYQTLGTLDGGTWVIQAKSFSKSGHGVRCCLLFLKVVQSSLLESDYKSRCVAGLKLIGDVDIDVSTDPKITLTDSSVVIRGKTTGHRQEIKPPS